LHADFLPISKRERVMNYLMFSSRWRRDETSQTGSDGHCGFRYMGNIYKEALGLCSNIKFIRILMWVPWANVHDDGLDLGGDSHAWALTHVA